MTAHAFDPAEESTEKVTGLPEAPPVAEIAAVLPATGAVGSVEVKVNVWFVDAPAGVLLPMTRARLEWGASVSQSPEMDCVHRQNAGLRRAVPEGLSVLDLDMVTHSGQERCETTKILDVTRPRGG